MSRKLNCWQFKNCGRERGGLIAEILGECNVPTAMEFDGLNEGIGAGRACWMVRGAACQNDATRQSRIRSCLDCEFYHRVVFEEEENVRFKFTATHV